MRFAGSCVALAVVTLALLAGATRSLAGPPLADDFQSGLNLTRWVQYVSGGGTWIWGSEGSNGFATSPPQPSYSYGADRQDMLYTAQSDFADFDMTWDTRLRSTGYDRDQRGIFFRLQNPATGYGYCLTLCMPPCGPVWGLTVYKPTGGVTLFVSSRTWTQGTWYSFRARFVGSHIQIRCWVKGGPEPATWDIDVVDPSATYAQGRIAFWDYLAGVTDADNVVITAINTIAPAAPATCISVAHPCVSVPVTIARNEATPIRGASVTLQLSPELALCSGLASITEGTYLNAGGGGGGRRTAFDVIDNGGGSYTVDCAILGLPCGETAAGGTLFTLDLGSTVATGTGTVSVTGVTLRDCDNATVSAGPGLPASVSIDETAPTAIVLGAAQRKTGNDADGTTKIDLSWTGTVTPGDVVKLYRAGWGNYPEYDDIGGGVPALPGYPPGSPWTLAGTVASGTTYADEPPARDVWYYVAFVVDACGNVSPVSNRTGGTLDYHLGDVSDGGTTCAGNNRVALEDISFLGAHYGVPLALNDPLNCLDVGPTLDYGVNTRPTTDNRLDFEDMMVVAMNYNVVSSPLRAMPVAAARDELAAEGPAGVLAGETFTAVLRMAGAGTVQGLSATLDWDRAVAELVGVEAGGLAQSQGAAVFGNGAKVDVAALGSGRTLVGEGELARVTFRAKAAGAPHVELAQVDARDTGNRPVELAGARLHAPTATLLASPMPNPFRGTTQLAWALARGGPVELGIYGVDGRRIVTLVHETRAAGSYRTAWSGLDAAGRAVPPGLYFVRLTAGAARQVRALVVLD